MIGQHQILVAKLHCRHDPLLDGRPAIRPARGNQAELNLLLVGGEQPRDSQDYGEAQETREPPHSPTTSRMSSRSSGFCEETWNAPSTQPAASSTRSSLV